MVNIPQEEYNSRWSGTKYKVIAKDRDIVGNTFYKFENLKKSIQDMKYH